MSFTKHYRETAKIWAPEYETDFRLATVKAYMKNNRLTKKQYIAEVRQEVKDNKSLIANLYKKDDNREAQQRFRDKKKKENELNLYRNKLFYSMPTESAWKSYTKHIVWNDNPSVVGIPSSSFTEVEQLIIQDEEYKPYSLSSTEIAQFFSFFHIRDYLEKRLEINGTSKFFITINMDALDHGQLRNFPIVQKKAVKIITKKDIDNYLSNLYVKYDGYHEMNYLSLFNIKNVEISIYKPKALNGKSYVLLPDFLRNAKKGLINIKNTDTKCFLYSVYCSLFTPIKNPDRVSHYNKLNTLKYSEDDFVNGMNIDNIPRFEEANQMRIYVYGLVDEEDKDNRGIEIKYRSEVYQNEEYPIVQLFLYKQHYCYIKNFNGLMGDKQSHNKVCPYCCDYVSRDCNSKTFEEHKKVCLKCNGAIIKMPEQDTIKFKNFSKMNEMPIRIYADFETFNDASMCHRSKNENTEFSTGHKPASFKLTVISDIPIDNFKLIEGKYTFKFIYSGKDSDVVFVEKLKEMEDKLMGVIEDTIEHYKDVKNMVFNTEDRHTHYSNKNCLMCNCIYDDINTKVRHHSHLNGKYIAPLCTNCNLKIKDKKFLPVFFHNLNYDKNVFFKAMISKNKDKKISILPDNKNCFKSFEVGNFHFIDTIRFMPSSLADLIKNLPDSAMKMLKSNAKNDLELMFMKKKAHFPYEWFDDIEKLNLSVDVLTKEHFNNKMTCSLMSDEDFEEVKEVIKTLNIKTFREYHDFYLNIDVDGLADVFEYFRSNSLKYYNIEPCHFVGCPSFAWEAMLLLTKTELELLKDKDMYEFGEAGIRGGQSVIFQKHTVANNKYLKDYDASKPSTYIIYLDANNLYGIAMSFKLPYDGFEWFYEMNEDIIINFNMEGDIGYIVEVDLEYPEHLHDLHNDYPLAPEKLKLGNCEKLCGTFNKKENYKVHIANLQYYLKMGMKLTKIHRCIKFNQKAYLKQWIDKNTEYRKEATTDADKDFFKLMNNAVFGKTMENVRDRIDIKIAYDDEDYFNKYNSKHNFNTHNQFEYDEKLIQVMELTQTKTVLDKPILSGFSILELSKLHMYKFHYDIMKPKYGDKIELLMTDTDSLLYKVETEDIYQDMYGIKEHFDMSAYSKDNKYYDDENEKVLGKFKDETAKGDKVIKEFVAIRPKCYAFNTNDLKETKKLKGVPKAIVKNNIDLKHYRDCIQGAKIEPVNITAIRGKELTNYTINMKKQALSDTDDKRIWNGTKSYAYGHYLSN